MARRYSGDVELRITHRGGRDYVATVRAPRERGTARVATRALFGDPTSPEAYDRVASAVLEAADEAAGGLLPLERDGRGRPLVRRTYQAPCPVPAPTPSGFTRVTRRAKAPPRPRRGSRKSR